MLRINAIKIEIVTQDGLYGFEQNFQKGLNIIRGDNSSGKSSLFQAILYALGLEELLGGKNEKTMQSVLKDQVEYPDSEFHKILQSQIYLEIENREVVTVKRSIINPSVNTKLVNVYFGKLLTEKTKNLKMQSMYIHDRGGASDELYGFHMFLSNFLGWDMPEVMNNQGQPTHLYVQQIAPAFMIEQKSGWSDFFATMPYYNIKQVASRVVEFILNMDIFENQKKRMCLNYREAEIRESWKTIFIQLSNIARDSRYNLQGIDENPSILDIDEIVLLKYVESGTVDISSELVNLRKEFIQLKKENIKTIGEKADLYEIQLKGLQDDLNQKSLWYDLLNAEYSLTKQQVEQYNEQLNDVVIDLQKNKSALKIAKLGGDINSQVAVSICPTCHQHIEDSLLPHGVLEVPMSIEENIQYLESKKKMVEKYIDVQRKKCDETQERIDALRSHVANIRSQIRLLKKDLVEDDRLPSISDIESRLNLEKKIEFYQRKIEEFNELKSKLKKLSADFEKLCSEKKDLSDKYSVNDNNKIKDFENYFKIALKEFEYVSKPVSTIKISTENYLPLTKLESGEIYNIRFDSSASDFIRCLWAYYIALMQTSLKYNANHPNLLMFDEPKQQDVSENGFRVFLNKLSKFTNEQILVFASFENKDESFQSATTGIEYNLIRIEDKLIKPLCLMENGKSE